MVKPSVRCLYCSKSCILRAGLARHISQSPLCAAQRLKALNKLTAARLRRRQRNARRNLSRRLKSRHASPEKSLDPAPERAHSVNPPQSSALADPPSRTAITVVPEVTETPLRRPSVTVEEVPDEDLPNPPQWGPHPFATPTRRTLFAEPEVTETPPRRPSVTVEEVPDEDMPNPPQWGPHPFATPTRRTLFAEPDPDPTAGRAYRFYPIEKQDPPLYDTKLADPDVFKEAEWLSNLPISLEDKDKYFSLPRTKDWHWKNMDELHREVDDLPHGPPWSRRTVIVEGDQGVEILDLWSRDPVEAVKQLIRNRRFLRHMRFASEVHWTSDDLETRKRVYGETWASEWWEMIQGLVGEDGTVVPIILSTDQTLMTRFSGSKKAWPVYLSIGNIGKDIRRKPSERAWVLIGYIPVSQLSNISNEERRRERRWQLFHTCMKAILEPLKAAGLNGVEMLCADGGVRRVHPILAAYIADYEEQARIACVRDGRCPICWVPNDERADISQEYDLRDRHEVLDALEDYWAGDSTAIKALGIRPTDPFWADLPFVEMSKCITPDLLHQIHKGVFDWIVKWCTAILGEKEVDRRIKGMPRFQQLRHFDRGISPLSQWTGTESKALASVFLPVLSGCDGEVVTAARSMLDFMYRAHKPEISEDDLEAMELDLEIFHGVKHAFVDPENPKLLPNEDRFNGIIKFHMLAHYTRAIRALGTPDGFNSEATERLHIDYVKLAWRASNHVNATEQMATYLQRKEAWSLLRAYLHDSGQLQDPRCKPLDSAEDSDDEDQGDEVGGADGGEVDGDDDREAGKRVWYPAPVVSIKRPTWTKRTSADLANHHGAPDFISATRTFLSNFTNAPPGTLFPLTDHTRFKVWTRCKLIHKRLPFLPTMNPESDSIRARPPSFDHAGREKRAGAFDVVLYSPIDKDLSNLHGVHRFQAGRVRAIFELPKHLSSYYPGKLAYVERFHPFSKGTPQPFSLHTTSQMMRDNQRCAAIIPLSHLRLACHLAPKYNSMPDPQQPLDSSTDVLSIHHTLYLNHYVSHFLFVIFDYWKQREQANWT
ncbi:hypothetical protein FRC09_000267 [Ceratobasidium sp. 395]|nr:hypothetical protein FRC09_000267 [Ceratobasidium sp. 395]